MKLILLLPILLYAALMLVNVELLRDFQNINLFGAQTLSIPVFMFSSYFIVLYAILVYLVYSWVNSLQAHKLKARDKEIVALKSELYNNQKDLLKSIQDDYREQLTDFRQDNDRKLETVIRFNEYTIEKVLDETRWDFTKYRKETQRLLAKSKWVDKSIFEKLKVWK